MAAKVRKQLEETLRSSDSSSRNTCIHSFLTLTNVMWMSLFVWHLSQEKRWYLPCKKNNLQAGYMESFKRYKTYTNRFSLLMLSDKVEVISFTCVIKLLLMEIWQNSLNLEKYHHFRNTSIILYCLYSHLPLSGTMCIIAPNSWGVSSESSGSPLNCW